MIDPWIDVPFDGRPRRFNRDRLATAVLLRMDHPDEVGAVARALQDDHGIPKAEAIELTVAANICIKQGIEP